MCVCDRCLEDYQWSIKVLLLVSENSLFEQSESSLKMAHFVFFWPVKFRIDEQKRKHFLNWL